MCPQNPGRSVWVGLSGPSFPCSEWGASVRSRTWLTGAMKMLRLLDVAQLCNRYRRSRFTDHDAGTAMAGSLRCYGQLSPLVVCLPEEAHPVLDGFKRLAAAPLGLKALTARLLEADERMAKAAIPGLNDTGRRPQEWKYAPGA